MFCLSKSPVKSRGILLMRFSTFFTIGIANKLYRTPSHMYPTAHSGNDLMSALALHNTLTCISPSRLAEEDNDKHTDRSRSFRSIVCGMSFVCMALLSPELVRVIMALSRWTVCLTPELRRDEVDELLVIPLRKEGFWKTGAWDRAKGDVEANRRARQAIREVARVRQESRKKKRGR
jgi:hypothetical protein